ncbi:MAG: UDP-3-O-acyl-N-acetylglucosamine deacetylase, partial [Candidatus Adiutrix sp.]|jgi:UDP-3-O-[3-hydroxymyristoyl] N-acetylglucosamine deacetylase|nr:UDP-3-O-acyl-N-acetylglucosamine deacetylase [Candidatus Adiutrix sp.]
LKPAPAGGGIHFKRLDLADAAPVKAAPENVASTTLATSIGRGDNSVGTVEHLLAALAALGLDNVNVEVDGPELPIFDGSAAPWVDLIKAAGVVTLNAPRSFFKATRPFKTAVGDKSIEVRPAACFSVEAHIDFNGSIGRQAFYYVGSEKAFTSEISSSRTFCLLKDVEMMQSRGLALGGALDNAVVVGDDGIINPEGLRFKDEFVRHKILDFIGDLSIAGAPILGQFILHKPGHELNRRFLAEALAQPGLLELTDARVEDRKKAAADPRPALGRLLALEDMTGQLAALAS